MDYTTRLTIPELELAVGPYETASVRLIAPALVQVAYLFEPGYPAILTLPNGDPGEPGEPDLFDWKHITTLHPVTFVSDDDALRLHIKTGIDIYPLLTSRELAVLEREVMAERRRAAEDARLDACLDGLFERGLPALLGACA